MSINNKLINTHRVHRPITGIKYRQHNISIDVEWVPGTNNDKADYISRIIDYDDWGVVYELFMYLDPFIF
jgi:phage I-like protein